MKSLKVFLTLCLVASFSFAFAQSFGFKAGANYSLAYGTPEQLGEEDIESVQGNIGFQIGALAGFELSDAVGLQVELLYETRNSTKRADFTNPLLGVDVAIESGNTYSFINLPVLLTFGSDRLKVYAGPNLAYMISGSSSISTKIGPAAVEENDVDQINDDDCRPCFEALEIGVQAGIVYNINPGLGLDLRAGHSLTDLTDNEKDTSILNPSQSRDDQDRQFYVQLGVQFKF